MFRRRKGTKRQRAALGRALTRDGETDRLMIQPLEPRVLLTRIVYVDDTAPSGGNGTSWALAYRDLQATLTAAVSGDEIHVGQGTYTPTATADRTISFQLKSGVSLLGGYAGYGATSPNARDYINTPSVLSGDIGAASDNSDNSYHVVVGSSVNAAATLDGFTITAGNAGGTSQTANGGGMYNVSGSPTISNCTFSGNFAGNNATSTPGYGGGVYNNSSSPTLTGCTFTGNSTAGPYGGSGGGAGMYNSNGSSPTLTNCTFNNNTACDGGSGGAMDNVNSSSPNLTNCTLSGNSASVGAGICDDSSSPSLTNCTISGGTAWGACGGMYNGNGSAPTLANCTFSGNSNDAMFNGSSSPSVTNCVFSGTVNGAGMVNSSSSPVLIACKFSGNSKHGLCNVSSSPTLTNCLFTGNWSNYNGGGMYNDTSSPTLTNCVFSGNWVVAGDLPWDIPAANGGGMFNTSSSPTLINCTFSGNAAITHNGVVGTGGAIYNINSSLPSLTNCVVSGNTAASSPQIYTDSGSPVISYSDVQGWTANPTQHIINGDPHFLRNASSGADGTWGTADDDDGDLRLGLSSPCIDAGSNAAVPVGATTDLAGRPRFYDVSGVPDTGSGTAPLVDMGAYESHPVGFVIINSGAAYANSASVSLTLCPPDSMANVASMRVSNNGASWSDWQTYAATSAWSLLSGDGAKTVYAQFKDASGNVSASYSAAITLDTVAPNTPSVSVTQSGRRPAWSWTSGGGGNGTFRYKLDSSDLTAGATLTTLAGYTPAADLSLGQHVLYVQECDSAGNWSASGSSTITVAPVNDNAVSNISRTLTQGAVLTFAAGDFAAAFSDPDDGFALQTVKITSLPGHGALKLASATVTLNQEVAAGQLGTLTYTPAIGYVGSDSFGWNGSDSFAYAASGASVNLTIGPAPTGTAVSSSASPSTYGQSVTFTAAITPASGSGPTGTVQFQIDGANAGGPQTVASGVAAYTTSSLTAGSHSVVAVYSGDGSFAGSTSAAFSQSVGKATPTIIWSTPAPITYGMALSATQLNANAGIAGGYVYSPALGVVPHAGTVSLGVTFTPTDTTDYTTATASVNLVVNKVALNVTADPKSRGYGAANPVFTYSLSGFVNGDTASVVSGSPGLSTAATSTSAPGGYPINVAVGTLTAGDYSFTPAGGTLTVTQAATTTVVTSSNGSSSYGQSVTFTATVTPASGSGPTGSVQFKLDGNNFGSPVTLLANGTAASSPTSTLSVGSHTVTAVYGGDTDFGGSTSAIFSQNVSKATPTISWSTPAPITYGAALSVTQLCASASVQGTFVYSPAAGTVPHAPNASLSVTFTPTDTTDYTAGTASVNLVVNKAAMSVAADPKSRAYGAANPAFTYSLSGFVNGDTASVVSGAPTLSTTATSASAPGVYPISVAIGTLTAGDYSLTPVSGSLAVTQAATTTTLASSDPSAPYGQAVSFMATVTPASGSGPTGTVQFKIDGSNFGSPVTLQGNGTATSNATSSLSLGTHAVTAVYSGDTNFTASTAAIFSQSVNKAAPVISWSMPAPIIYGTALSYSQLSANSGMPGVYLYSPALGAVPHAGTASLSVTFSPSDTTHYTSANASVNLSVNKAMLNVTADPKSRGYGAANPALTYSFSGFVNGDGPSAVSGAPALSTPAIAASTPGMYAIDIAANALAAADYTFNLFPSMLTVNPAATATVVTSSNDSSTYGQAVTLTATVTPASGSGPTGTVRFQVDGADAGDPVTLSSGVAAYTTSGLPAGSHAIVATYSGDDDFAGGASPVFVQQVDPTGLVAGPGAAYSYTGPVGAQTLSVAAGSVALNSDLGSSIPNLSIASGAAVCAHAPQRLATLCIAQNGSGACLGTFDLGSNPLILAAGDIGTWTGAGYGGVSGMLASAFACGQWNGPGMTCSAAHGNSNYGLGILTAAQAAANGNPITNFHGQNVSGSDVLVQYGWNGDLNMDGAVNYLDYGVADNTFIYDQAHPNSPRRGYASGDVNFDGAINYLDYGIMDNAYLAQTAPHASAASAATAMDAVGAASATSPAVVTPGTSPFSTAPLAAKPAGESSDVLMSVDSNVL